MADLSNPIDQILVGQSNKETTANELFDASSPATVGGRRASTCAGLVWGYYGGRWRGMEFPHATLTLDASEANIYIVIERATGVVSFSTSDTNWNDTTDYDRLYWAETGPSTVTDYDDYREMLSSAALGATGTVAADAIWDAKGDLVAGTGANAGARVAVGTNGQTLYADSTQSTGVRWDDPAGGAAADVTVDSTTLVGTGTDAQAVFEELDNAIVAAEAAIAAHIADATAAHAASAVSADSTTLVGTGTDVQAVLEELDNAIVAAEGSIAAHISDASAAHAASALSVDSTGFSHSAASELQTLVADFDAAIDAAAGAGAPTGADYLVGTAHAGLSAEIVVGTTPGGELGGTWASPTVDATHSGSTHAAVQAAAEATAAAALAAHVTDTGDAHDASAISVDSTTLVGTGIDAQAVIEELDNAIVACETSIADHLADSSAAHAASAIAFTPNGSIAATDVQAAIQEVRDEAAGGGAVATDVIWDAKGDLAGGTGANTAVRLAVGANTFVLTADSAETTGMKWAAGGGSSAWGAITGTLASQTDLMYYIHTRSLLSTPVL